MDLWQLAMEKRRGRVRREVKYLLGTCVVSEGLTLVTRNVTDMANLGAVIFNPWDGQYARDTE